MHLIQEALAQKQKKQTFFRERTMAAHFTMSGRPSPGSAASAEKIVAVIMACDCCTGDNFADPCTLSSSCKRSRCHPHSLPNKKAIFFSVDDHHAATGDSLFLRLRAHFTPRCGKNRGEWSLEGPFRFGSSFVLLHVAWCRCSSLPVCESVYCCCVMHWIVNLF